MKIRFGYLFLFVASFLSCSDSDPEIPQEAELITTLRYQLIPSMGGAPVTFLFSDPDGDGGNAPIIMTGTLEANESYIGSLQVLNESVTPEINITTEIVEEAVDHQFFFIHSIPELAITYRDVDENGNPLGLTTGLTTGAAASGNLTIVLRHEPNKNAAGVSEGNIENAGGETDIEVTFAVDIE